MSGDTLSYLTEHTIGVPKADISHRVYIVARIMYSSHNSSRKTNIAYINYYTHNHIYRVMLIKMLMKCFNYN